jgi:hypothetical protein
MVIVWCVIISLLISSAGAVYRLMNRLVIALAKVSFAETLRVRLAHCYLLKGVQRPMSA